MSLRYDTRFMRRVGRPNTERARRLASLVKLIDNFDEEFMDAEVFLPLNYTARVLKMDVDRLILDLTYLAGDLGCLNWFTITVGGHGRIPGVRVAVITTGESITDVDNDLFDRAYAVLIRLGLSAQHGRAA